MKHLDHEQSSHPLLPHFMSPEGFRLLISVVLFLAANLCSFIAMIFNFHRPDVNKDEDIKCFTTKDVLTVKNLFFASAPTTLVFFLSRLNAFWGVKWKENSWWALNEISVKIKLLSTRALFLLLKRRFFKRCPTFQSINSLWSYPLKKTFEASHF